MSDPSAPRQRCEWCTDHDHPCTISRYMPHPIPEGTCFTCAECLSRDIICSFADGYFRDLSNSASNCVPSGISFLLIFLPIISPHCLFLMYSDLQVTAANARARLSEANTEVHLLQGLIFLFDNFSPDGTDSSAVQTDDALHFLEEVHVLAPYQVYTTAEMEILVSLFFWYADFDLASLPYSEEPRNITQWISHVRTTRSLRQTVTSVLRPLNL